MWDIIESQHAGFHRDDITTWDKFKSTGKYGLSMRGPSFHPVLVNNRQNPLLFRILQNIVGDDPMISHDRFSIYRSTAIDGGERFKTIPNIHLDLNPWWWLESSSDVTIGAESLQYDDEQDFIKENNLVVRANGMHVQGVINLDDNLSEDGGTLIVPGFHKQLESWCAKNESRLRKPLPWITLGAKDNENFLRYGQRVPMRQGSVLIWNQVVMHGSSPNSSSRCRMGQYFKAFPRSQSISDDRLKRRASALHSALSKSGAIDIVSSVGRNIFGLDYSDS